MFWTCNYIEESLFFRALQNIYRRRFLCKKKSFFVWEIQSCQARLLSTPPPPPPTRSYFFVAVYLPMDLSNKRGVDKKDNVIAESRPHCFVSQKPRAFPQILWLGDIFKLFFSLQQDPRLWRQRTKPATPQRATTKIWGRRRRQMIQQRTRYNRPKLWNPRKSCINKSYFQDPDPRPPPATPVAEPKRPLHPRLESVQVRMSLKLCASHKKW